MDKVSKMKSCEKQEPVLECLAVYEDKDIMVEKCMQTAGIDYEGRHHGPHSLRHSLATNMLAENVPISAISNIMGHSSTKTTEIYLTVDETHLKESSLEVPNA